jgi:hypothetical protein
MGEGRVLDLKEESILGPRIKDHWYYVAKGRALRELLGGRRVPRQRPLYLVDEEIGAAVARKDRERQELRDAMRLLREVVERGRAAPSPASKSRRQRTG